MLHSEDPYSGMASNQLPVQGLKGSLLLEGNLLQEDVTFGSFVSGLW